MEEIGMSLFKKLFGPSLDELAAKEAALKKVPQQQFKQYKETFKEKLQAWIPPAINPPETIGNYILNRNYSYKDVTLKVIPDNIQFDFDMIGKEVDLIPEPCNAYDPGAIYVTLNSTKIGYIPKNRLQDMIHDYRKKEQPIYTIISNINVNEDTETIENISIFIGFYHNPYIDLDKYDRVTAKLTKTAKKDEFDNYRRDNFCFIDNGDFVNLVYCFDTETYIVSADGNELGETSAPITKKLKDFNTNCDYIGIIDKITENEAGNYGADILIYLKPF
jgi:hypothetical protein